MVELLVRSNEWMEATLRFGLVGCCRDGVMDETSVKEFSTASTT